MIELSLIEKVIVSNASSVLHVSSNISPDSCSKFLLLMPNNFLFKDSTGIKFVVQ